MLIRDNRIINVKIVNNTDKQAIILYLDQIITNWINQNSNEWFCINDLLDFALGQHKNWSNTPLQVLYNNQINSGKTHQKALKSAGQAVGKLLKETVHNRIEQFDTKKLRRMYYKKI